jgi:hypothetical protein
MNTAKYCMSVQHHDFLFAFLVASTPCRSLASIPMVMDVVMFSSLLWLGISNKQT